MSDKCDGNHDIGAPCPTPAPSGGGNEEQPRTIADDKADIANICAKKLTDAEFAVLRRVLGELDRYQTTPPQPDHAAGTAREAALSFCNQHVIGEVFRELQAVIQSAIDRATADLRRELEDVSARLLQQNNELSARYVGELDRVAADLATARRQVAELQAALEHCRCVNCHGLIRHGELPFCGICAPARAAKEQP